MIFNIFVINVENHVNFVKKFNNPPCKNVKVQYIGISTYLIDSKATRLMICNSCFLSFDDSNLASELTQV